MQIAFLYTALNELYIFSCKNSNAYLEAPRGKKLWTLAGKEFFSLDGTPIQIYRAFYGNSWHKAIPTTLSYINFEPSRADPDIWLRMSTNLRGEKYLERIVVYVENLLAISEEPKAITDYFSMYNLKDTASPPDRYLAANVVKWQFSDDSNCW